jgi:glutathione peroxidase
MKFGLILFIAALLPVQLKAEEVKKMDSFYNIEVKDIDGAQVSLSKYTGKVALVVNVASKCGFTGQYEGLESLYRKYKDRGFVVLGFPSNDFMSQEPGTDSDIKTFCKTKYDVSFPMFSKGSVTGDSKQPAYVYLTEKGPENLTGEIRWNFEKILVDQNGQVVDRWRSITGPTSASISKQIEALLAKNSTK